MNFAVSLNPTLLADVFARIIDLTTDTNRYLEIWLLKYVSSPNFPAVQSTYHPTKLVVGKEAIYRSQAFFGIEHRLLFFDYIAIIAILFLFFYVLHMIPHLVVSSCQMTEHICYD